MSLAINNIKSIMERYAIELNEKGLRLDLTKPEDVNDAYRVEGGIHASIELFKLLHDADFEEEKQDD